MAESLEEEVRRLRAENETLKVNKKEANRGVSFKVSQKGAVSLYGLGRFPVTLYKEQWERLFEAAEDLKAFIQEHAAELKTKD